LPPVTAHASSPSDGGEDGGDRAGDLAADDERGRTVGFMASGILTGILVSPDGQRCRPGPASGMRACSPPWAA
jgi:hypothetical protein